MEEEKSFFEKTVEQISRFKTWILGFGILGIALWWIIKIIACFFLGICII